MGRQPHNALQQAVWRLSGCGLNRSMQHLISNYRGGCGTTRLVSAARSHVDTWNHRGLRNPPVSRVLLRRQNDHATPVEGSSAASPLKIAGLCADKLITGDSKEMGC